MKTSRAKWILALLVAFACLSRQGLADEVSDELAAQGLELGSRVYLRVVKLPQYESRSDEYDVGKPPFYAKYNVNVSEPGFPTLGTMEAWVQGSDGKYHLFKRYKIGNWSGFLGPKQDQGDHQTPEGFYDIAGYKPDGSHGPALSVSYPNPYDRALGRTGGEIEVHGTYASDGCMAMGDSIDPIYELVTAAKKRGNVVPIDIFPFPMTNANLQAAQNDGNPSASAWESLTTGYWAIQDCGVPPSVTFTGREQVIDTCPAVAARVATEGLAQAEHSQPPSNCSLNP